MSDNDTVLPLGMACAPDVHIEGASPRCWASGAQPIPKGKTVLLSDITQGYEWIKILIPWFKTIRNKIQIHVMKKLIKTNMCL